MHRPASPHLQPASLDLLAAPQATEGAEPALFSGLSIELGHFYPADLAAGFEALRACFERIAPFAEIARKTAPGGRASTCFLIDEYRNEIGRDKTPREILGKLVLPAMVSAGLGLPDYIGREGGCAGMAQEVLDNLREPKDPTGRRPPLSESRFLHSDIHPLSTSSRSRQAMMIKNQPLPGDELTLTEPSFEHVERYNKALYMEIELFDLLPNGAKRWSCPHLAAVWYMLRLGLLDGFKTAVTPQPAPRDANGELDFGDDWDALPVIMQTNPDANPFQAYQARSFMSGYNDVEVAASILLRHLAVDGTDEHIRKLAWHQGIRLPHRELRLLGSYMQEFGIPNSEL